MKVEQISINNLSDLTSYGFKLDTNTIDLALVFSSRNLMSDPKLYNELKKTFANAILLGCSTSGEINDINVKDDSISLTAIDFEKTMLTLDYANIDDFDDSYKLGEYLSKKIDKTNLRHVFCLSEGLKVNGSELVHGLNSNLPEGVTVTGGLAGDSDKFEKTVVLTSDGMNSGKVAILSFYGESLKIGFGSLGGWDDFGVDRLITKSKANVLYEIDGQSALALYKKYLGDHAKDLPASGLLFPLSLRSKDDSTPVVRTILSINEDEQSITFAGDVPEGSLVRFQKANFDRLIDGATSAAATSYEAIGFSSPELAILISCVGRKMVLKQRIEEEVEAVREVLGEKSVLAGFYSYGEISPFTPNAKCELHNQTMTITTFSE